MPNGDKGKAKAQKKGRMQKAEGRKRQLNAQGAKARRNAKRLQDRHGDTDWDSSGVGEGERTIKPGIERSSLALFNVSAPLYCLAAAALRSFAHSRLCV